MLELARAAHLTLSNSSTIKSSRKNWLTTLDGAQEFDSITITPAVAEPDASERPDRHTRPLNAFRRIRRRQSVPRSTSRSKYEKPAGNTPARTQHSVRRNRSINRSGIAAEAFLPEAIAGDGRVAVPADLPHPLRRVRESVLHQADGKRAVIPQAPPRAADHRAPNHAAMCGCEKMFIGWRQAHSQYFASRPVTSPEPSGDGNGVRNVKACGDGPCCSR